MTQQHTDPNICPICGNSATWNGCQCSNAVCVSIKQKQDPNAAYNAEVRRIAGILAKSYHGYAHDTSPPEVQEQDIDGHIREARAMVAEMAKQYNEGWSDGENYCECEGEYVRNMENEMVLRGLIPSPENEQK